MAAASDTREDRSQGAWVSVQCLHQVKGIIIGGSLHAAGIACLQDSLRRNDNGASAHEVSKQQAKQQRHGAVLQHCASAVAMRWPGLWAMTPATSSSRPFQSGRKDIKSPRQSDSVGAVVATMTRWDRCPAAQVLRTLLRRPARRSASPDPHTKRAPEPLLSRMLRTCASTAAPSLISAA